MSHTHTHTHSHTHTHTHTLTHTHTHTLLSLMTLPPFFLFPYNFTNRYNQQNSNQGDTKITSHIICFLSLERLHCGNKGHTTRR
jgi:hypothetical protein